MDRFTDDGKLGQGFTSVEDLIEVDIGNGDRPRPTFISAKLDSECKQQLIELLKEYKDCFAWDYIEMSGLDRSIIEHLLSKVSIRDTLTDAHDERTRMPVEASDSMPPVTQTVIDVQSLEHGKGVIRID